MHALKFFLLFLLPVIASATTSEGFVRLKSGNVFIDRGADPKSVVPEERACDANSLKGHKDVYVQIDWTENAGKKCFTVNSVRPIVYDPLKNSRLRK